MKSLVILNTIFALLLCATQPLAAQEKPGETSERALGIPPLPPETPDKTGIVKPNKHEEPSAMVSGEDSYIGMFNDATADISSDSSVTSPIIRVVKKLSELQISTGGFVIGSGNRVAPQIEAVKPKDGMTFVKVIFDRYAASNEVLWKDKITLVDGAEVSEPPIQLLKIVKSYSAVEKKGKKLVIIGFTGIKLDLGGNRLAAIFAVKDGDAARFKLRIAGTDYPLNRSYSEQKRIDAERRAAQEKVDEEQRAAREKVDEEQLSRLGKMASIPQKPAVLIAKYEDACKQGDKLGKYYWAHILVEKGQPYMIQRLDAASGISQTVLKAAQDQARTLLKKP